MKANNSERTRLRKNDTVKVVSGNDKGTVGKILFIDRQKGRLIVEGVNIIHRHTKRSQKNPQGAIVKREAPISISNVMMMCPKTNQPTRLGTRISVNESTGKRTRDRLSRKSGEIITD